MQFSSILKVQSFFEDKIEAQSVGCQELLLFLQHIEKFAEFEKMFDTKFTSKNMDK